MVKLGEEIDFGRGDYDLEEFMLFAIMVPGKKASTTVRLVDDILRKMHSDVDLGRELKPFELIRSWLERHPHVDFAIWLRHKGVGCYNHRAKAIKGVVESGLNLRECTIEDLEKLYGVGQKTSRFFLMCNRPNVKAAILDRHILRYLSQRGYSVPESTPTNKAEYKRIERIFLREAERNDADPMQFDYAIWKEGAGVNSSTL